MNPAQVPYLKSWFLFFVIATIGGIVVGAIVGGALGFALGAAGVALTTIPIVTAAVGFVLSLPISYYSFKWSVGRYIVAPVLSGRGE
ncbi:MAG TPA: hypothetical protein VFG21_08925 [Xanthomonadaceae bacterium]|nr:hypothetical protein [Xanthomonadaceae bacterium]